MSVTKNMTVIALLKLLHQKGISVNASIGKYLPAQWAKDQGLRVNGINRIRFRHLLTHTSGIRQAMIAAPDSAGLGNGLGRPAQARQVRRRTPTPRRGSTRTPTTR